MSVDISFSEMYNACMYTCTNICFYTHFDDEVELPDCTPSSWRPVKMCIHKSSMPVFELRPVKILHVDCTPSETE